MGLICVVVGVYVCTRWKGVTAGCETTGGIRNGRDAPEVEKQRKAWPPTSEKPEEKRVTIEKKTRNGEAKTD